MSGTLRSSLSSQLSTQSGNVFTKNVRHKRLLLLLISLSLINAFLEFLLISGEDVPGLDPSPLSLSEEGLSLTQALTLSGSISSIVGAIYLPIYLADALFSFNIRQVYFFFWIYFFQFGLSGICVATKIIEAGGLFQLGGSPATKDGIFSTWGLVAVTGLDFFLRGIGVVFAWNSLSRLRSDLIWTLYRHTGANIDTYKLVRARQRLWAILKVSIFWVISSLIPWYFICFFGEVKEASPMHELMPVLNVVATAVLSGVFLFLGIIGLRYEKKPVVALFVSLWALGAAFGMYLIYTEIFFLKGLDLLEILSPRLFRGILSLFAYQFISLILMLVLIIMSVLSIPHFGQGLRLIPMYSRVKSYASLFSTAATDSNEIDNEVPQRSSILESQIDLFHYPSTQASTRTEASPEVASSANSFSRSIFRKNVKYSVTDLELSDPVSSTRTTSFLIQPHNANDASSEPSPTFDSSSVTVPLLPENNSPVLFRSLSN